MKILKDKLMVFSLLWAFIFYLFGWFSSQFHFFPLGLLPLSLYEFKRTEGKKNTKPLSFLTSLLLTFQFLHTSGLYLFPWDTAFLLDLLPSPVPESVDSFLFISVILLLIFSLLLIKHTWGSVTKFLAITLLAGALVQAYLFWPIIQIMMQSPEGKVLLEGQKERIKDNLFYRLRRELY